MAIKVIVELQAKPGMRGELMGLIERVVAEQGPTQGGFLGSTRYEVLDDPDTLIEIAEWESAEARAAHMEQAAATGRLRTSPRDVGRTIQGNSDQAAALTAQLFAVALAARCSRRQSQSPAYGLGLNNLQCPSETTSTLPAATLMAV